MSRHRDTSKSALSRPHFSSQTFVKLAIACAAGLSAALLAVASQLITGFWLGEAGTWPKQWGGLIASAATISVVVGALVWRFVTKPHKHARHPAAHAANVPSKLAPLHASGAAPWKFILPVDAISVYDGHFTASPSLQQLLGLDPSDPIKALGDLTKRMPEADAVNLLAQVRACLEGRDDTIDTVVRIENSQREPRKLLIRGAAPALASYSRQRVALGIAIDLGHADDGAEVSALLYRLFDSVNERCAVVDANGLLMACNSSLRESLAAVNSSAPYLALKQLSLVGPNHTPLRNLLALAAKHQRWEGDVWVENRADADRPQRMYCRIIACGPQLTMQECYWVSLSYDRPHSLDAAKLHHRDALTGLPQVRSFIQRLTADLEGARLSDVDVNFVVIRLDNVVDINRGFGVEAGDQVIRIVADRLAALPGTALARTSGTRFCMILAAGISPKATQAWLDRARKEVTRSVVVDDETIMPELAFDATQIQADETPVQALRRAESGAHTSHHAPANHTALTAESRMRVLNRTAVQRAVSDDGLQCFYQPLVSLNGGGICGAEALTRITVAGEQLTPGAWWPAADGLGLLPQIDQWILGKALDDVASWQAEGILQPGFRLSVNACADTITEAWQAHVTQCLARTGVAPDLLRIEITEQHAVADSARCAAILEPLRDLGIRIALDDFGTGMSSLAQLSELPIDIIKVDRSFVRGLPDSPSACEMVTSMLHLAERLNLVVVVEGVETHAQHNYLARIGCEFAQGFLYSEALPSADFRTQLLAADELGSDQPGAGHLQV